MLGSTWCPQHRQLLPHSGTACRAAARASLPSGRKSGQPSCHPRPCSEKFWRLLCISKSRSSHSSRVSKTVNSPAGGRGVIEGLGAQLQLDERQRAPAAQTLCHYGARLSSTVRTAAPLQGRAWDSVDTQQ